MDSEGAKSNADESTDGPMAKKEKLDVLIEKGNSFEKPTIVIKRLDKKSDKVKSLYLPTLSILNIQKETTKKADK